MENTIMKKKNLKYVIRIIVYLRKYVINTK